MLPVFVCHAETSVQAEALRAGYDFLLEKPCLSVQFANMLAKYGLGH